jgi:hypothetical protein
VHTRTHPPCHTLSMPPRRPQAAAAAAEDDGPGTSQPSQRGSQGSNNDVAVFALIQAVLGRGYIPEAEVKVGQGSV